MSPAHATTDVAIVEPYISGVRELPSEGPAYYRPGEESEAQVCARELGIAWKSHAAFRKWLRGRG